MSDLDYFTNETYYSERSCASATSGRFMSRLCDENADSPGEMEGGVGADLDYTTSSGEGLGPICTTRDYTLDGGDGPFYLPITETEAEVCIEQIVDRCDELGDPYNVTAAEEQIRV